MRELVDQDGLLTFLSMRSAFLILLLTLLLGAGCRHFSPSPASTPTSTSEVPVVSPVSGPNGWKIYENVLEGFAFHYPPDAIWMDGGTVDTDSIATIDLGTRVASTSAISVPTTMLYVRILSATDPRMQNGYLSEAGWSDDAERVATSEKRIGNHTVYLASEQDAAAGSRYASYAYAIPHDDEFVILNFIVHSVNCQNYDDPTQCVSFDEERDTSGFEEIIETLQFTERAVGTKIDAHLFVTEIITEKTAQREIEVSYPRLEGFADAAAQTAFNEIMHERVATSVAAFRASVDEESIEWDPGMSAWTFYGDYRVYPGAYGRFSVVRRISEYTGGAHPNTAYETTVFDLASRKALTLKDIFRSNVDYVSFLSEESLKELRRRNELQDFTDEGWLLDGAGPVEQNFQQFYLSDAGLVIIFPPYQVAAYAAGTSEVLIPYEALSGKLVL